MKVWGDRCNNIEYNHLPSRLWKLEEWCDQEIGLSAWHQGSCHTLRLLLRLHNHWISKRRRRGEGSSWCYAMEEEDWFLRSFVEVQLMKLRRGQRGTHTFEGKNHSVQSFVHNILITFITVLKISTFWFPRNILFGCCRGAISTALFQTVNFGRAMWSIKMWFTNTILLLSSCIYLRIRRYHQAAP